MAKQSKPAKAAAVKAPTPPVKEEKAVVVKEKTAVTEFDEAFADLAGAGHEEARQSDIALPMLRVVQLLSPQMDPQKPEYNADAEAGDILNSATGELYGGEDGIRFLPCFFKSAYLEWWPRDSKQGKGFVKEHSIDSDIMSTTEKDERGRDMTKKGTYIIDTAHHYGLLIEDDGTCIPALITMSSTQRKKSKQWVAKMRGVTVPIKDKATGKMTTKVAPSFLVIYKLTSTPESNDKGRWNGWVVDFDRTLNVKEDEDRAIFEQGLAFYNVCREGLVTVKYDEPEDTAASDDSVGSGAGSIL